MESQRNLSQPSVSGGRQVHDSVPDSFGSSPSGSPLTDADEWQLLSERGGSSQAVFVPKNVKSTAQDEGRNIFQPWDQANAGPVPRLPLTRDGTTGQRADQIFRETQLIPSASTPELHRASVGDHGTPPRNASSVVDDDEFFTSEGYFSAMPPSARTAPSDNEPRSGSRSGSRAGDSSPAAVHGKIPEVPAASSPTTHQSGSPTKSLPGDASPTRDLTERYMPARGLSALDSFLNASEVELGALELLAQCRGDIATTEGAFAQMPAVTASDAAPKVGAEHRVQDLSGSAPPQISSPAEEKKDPMDADAVDATQLKVDPRVVEKKEEILPSADPQLNPPPLDGSTNSPQSIRAAVTFFFTWAIHMATKKDSSSTTVVATCLIASIGLGGLAELLRNLSSSHSEDSTSVELDPNQVTRTTTKKSSRRVSEDRAQEIETLASSQLRTVESGLVAGVNWIALLCGIPVVSSAAEAGSKPLSSSGGSPHQRPGDAKSGKRMQQEEPDNDSIQDQFKAEILRVPPLIRFGCCMFTCTVLLGPITQWLTVGAIIRGGSVLATLLSTAQMLGHGEMSKAAASTSFAQDHSVPKRKPSCTAEKCFSGEVD